MKAAARPSASGRPTMSLQAPQNAEPMANEPSALQRSAVARARTLGGTLVWGGGVEGGHAGHPAATGQHEHGVHRPGLAATARFTPMAAA